jgi:bifunctional UDP-N-acetylglucosamine pyrophosphorylase/glucosamine-1-phosphate N-acetyltransferase
MTEANNTWEVLLAQEEKKEQKRLATIRKHMEAGVVFFDWKAAYIDPEVMIGEGTAIGTGVILSGKTEIGRNCVIGHHTRIEDSTVGNEVEIEQSVVLKSRLGDRSKIGPFAYLRPNSNIGSDAKVGDFVEIKNSTLGNGSKASHLTYIGDSDVGEGVNLGCGVVFVNYDGAEKHRSVVEDGAFIGCNTNLISPVNVGKGAYVAAGTTVTKDVPPGALCIGREKARCIEGWVEKRGILKKKK